MVDLYKAIESRISNAISFVLFKICFLKLGTKFPNNFGKGYANFVICYLGEVLRNVIVGAREVYMLEPEQRKQIGTYYSDNVLRN